MNITLIDDVPRKGLCAICHRNSSFTVTVLITSKNSPITSTEDWCMRHYNSMRDKTLSLQ